MPDIDQVLDNYRSGAAHQFTPPPVDDLVAAGRRRARRKATVWSAAAATAVALSVAVVVIRPGGTDVPPAENLEGVDWTHATITLPSSGDQACPIGKQRLEPGDAAELPGIGKVDNPSGKSLAILPGGRNYGDLTGDGVPEVVLPVWCSRVLEQTFGESGAQLLVVSRTQEGALVGLGYAGPVGAHYLSFRIQNGKLVTQVAYQTLATDATVYSVYAPAHTRTYSWSGDHFAQISGRTTPLVLAPDKEPRGSLTRLPALLKQDGSNWCPAADIRFTPDSATTGGATYLVTDNVQQTDLDHDGNNELLVEIACRTKEGTANSVYLLSQGANALTTQDVPFANDGSLTIENWSVSDAKLTITFQQASGKPKTTVLTWAGSRFEPRIGAFRPVG